MKKTIENYFFILTLSLIACNTNAEKAKGKADAAANAKNKSQVNNLTKGTFNATIQPINGAVIVFSDTTKNMQIIPQSNNKRLAIAFYNNTYKLILRVSATQPGTYPLVTDPLLPDTKTSIANAFVVVMDPVTNQQTDYKLNEGSLTITDYTNNLLTATIQGKGEALNYSDKSKNNSFTFTGTFNKVTVKN